MNDLKEILKKENIKKYFINSLKFVLRIITWLVIIIVLLLLGLFELGYRFFIFFTDRIYNLLNYILDNQKLQNLLTYKK